MNVKISIPNQEAHPTFGNLLVHSCYYNTGICQSGPVSDRLGFGISDFFSA